MFSFGMNTRPETFVSLIYRVTDDALSQAMPDLLEDLGLREQASCLRQSAPLFNYAHVL